MPNALETPWLTLEVNDVPLSLCNELGRPNHGMISWNSFFLPPPQPSQSWWESLQSILWMYLSWLVGIEKLASGGSRSASPLPGRSHVIGQGGPAGVLKLLGSCLTGKWNKRPLALVIWKPVPLKDLSSNLWRAFSLKWVVAFKS